MNTERPLSQYSLERLVPSELTANDATGADTLELHLARYRFAARFIDGGRVLDCACGVGYGTEVLANSDRKPEYVQGVDIDPSAIDYAKRTYLSERMDFRVGDGATLTDSAGFDTIVSLETIEHVQHPESVLQNFVRLLKPGGMLIASVPVTPSVDVNPYHVHDFTERSFRRLGDSLGLREIDALTQKQPFNPLTIIRGKEARLEDMRKSLPLYYAGHPKALAKRLWSTLADGFCNKYLTVAWTKPVN